MRPDEVIEGARLPMRRRKSRGSQDFRDRVFEGFLPGRKRNRFRSESGKKVDMVRHQDVAADPHAVIGSTQSKLDKGLMNLCACQDASAIVGTRGHKIDGIFREKPRKTSRSAHALSTARSARSQTAPTVVNYVFPRECPE